MWPSNAGSGPKTGKFTATWAKKRQFSALTAKFGFELKFTSSQHAFGAALARLATSVERKGEARQGAFADLETTLGPRGFDFFFFKWRLRGGLE